MPVVPYSLSIVLAYLIGSISAAWIVGRIAGNIDMRNEPDGRISAAAVHQKLGLAPFAMVVILDVAFALVAVLIAGLLTENSTNIMMLAGAAAVAGHNWSVFLKFKGGQGATAILGALAGVLAWQAVYPLAIAGILLLATHKSTLSTAVGLIGSSGILIIQNGLGLVSAFPLLLFCLMLIKKYQMARNTRIAGP